MGFTRGLLYPVVKGKGRRLYIARSNRVMVIGIDKGTLGAFGVIASAITGPASLMPPVFHLASDFFNALVPTPIRIMSFDS